MPFSSALFLALLACIPPALYGDATAHGIGRIPGDKQSMSAGAWSLLAAVPSLGMMFAIGYLLSRGELIDKAQVHPIRVPRRRRVLSTCVLLLLGCVSTTLAVLATA